MEKYKFQAKNQDGLLEKALKELNTTEENKISLILPENNSYLYSATLYFENNLPASLTYFDKNGTAKVNIIYNEFKSL